MEPGFLLPPTPGADEAMTLDLLLERAILIEAHTTKRFETLRTQLGVGYAILIALVGAIITTAGTLFKDGLGEHPLFPILGGAEFVAILFSFLAFRKAYRQLNETVGPDILNAEKMNAFVRTRSNHAKALIFRTIQTNVETNLQVQLASAMSVDIGFFFLTIAIFTTLVHAVISGMIAT